MQYSLNQGIITSQAGLPWAPRWFCDGRTAVEMDNDCIQEINYFSPATDGSYIMFRKRFWAGMRFYLNEKKVRPEHCEIWPFGFTSRGEDCTYGLWVSNDCVHMTLTPSRDNAKLVFEFYEDTIFTPDNADRPDIRYGGPPRRVTGPEFEDGCLKIAYTEGENTNYITFAADRPMAFSVIGKGNNVKYALTAQNLPAGVPFELQLRFSPEGYQPYREDSVLYAQQRARYQAVAEKAPVLKSKDPSLNAFFQLAPMYHESLKTVDVPGAIRAQSTHYWVWGWDSMTSNECSFYWGDMDFMGRMLQCMEAYSDPQEGIPHAFSRKMTCGGAAAPPAQGMYITLLDTYRIAGGDYQKHYAFAKQIFDTICASEVENTGLCSGTSLYPDFRDLIHETGNDISGFNNTVSYCAIRSMEAMARACGDVQTEQTARAFGHRLQGNFEKALYNEKLGFFDSSADSADYEKRNVPSNNAIKWENNYCKELVWGKKAECLDFYRRHLVRAPGIRPIPDWCDCYDADANQLHCWWTVMSEFYTRLCNAGNEPQLLEQYAGWIGYWAEKLMCPEGIPCYDDNAQVPFDNWNCLCGIWHGYSIRGFYNAIVHSYVGVDFDEAGMNFYPYSGEEVAIENLHFGKYSFDIQMLGSGPQIQAVKLNGKDLGSLRSIPFAWLSEKNQVVVMRAGEKV